MNWRFCIDTPEQRALKLCRGSMNTGDGCGYGDGWGDGKGYGYGYSWGCGEDWGDGLSGSGDGISKKSWEQN